MSKNISTVEELLSYLSREDSIPENLNVNGLMEKIAEIAESLNNENSLLGVYVSNNNTFSFLIFDQDKENNLKLGSVLPLKNRENFSDLKNEDDLKTSNLYSVLNSLGIEMLDVYDLKNDICNHFSGEEFKGLNNSKRKVLNR